MRSTIAAIVRGGERKAVEGPPDPVEREVVDRPRRRSSHFGAPALLLFSTRGGAKAGLQETPRRYGLASPKRPHLRHELLLPLLDRFECLLEKLALARTLGRTRAPWSQRSFRRVSSRTPQDESLDSPSCLERVGADPMFDESRRADLGCRSCTRGGAAPEGRVAESEKADRRPTPPARRASSSCGARRGGLAPSARGQQGFSRSRLGGAFKRTGIIAASFDESGSCSSFDAFRAMDITAVSEGDAAGPGKRSDALKNDVALRLG